MGSAEIIDGDTVCFAQTLNCRPMKCRCDVLSLYVVLQSVSIMLRGGELVLTVVFDTISLRNTRAAAKGWRRVRRLACIVVGRKTITRHQSQVTVSTRDRLQIRILTYLCESDEVPEA